MILWHPPWETLMFGGNLPISIIIWVLINVLLFFTYYLIPLKIGSGLLKLYIILIIKLSKIGTTAMNKFIFGHFSVFYINFVLLPPCYPLTLSKINTSLTFIHSNEWEFKRTYVLLYRREYWDDSSKLLYFSLRYLSWHRDTAGRVYTYYYLRVSTLTTYWLLYCKLLIEE